MRVLVLGAGGVGSSAAAVAAKRSFFERMVLADVDAERAGRSVAGLGDRFGSAQVDASDVAAIVDLVRAERADAVLNACDPRFNPPILEAAPQTFWGKPSSMPPWLGSSQREVTTLPRV